MSINLFIFHALNGLTGHSPFFDWLVFITAGYGDILTITAALAFLALLSVADQGRRHPFTVWIKEVILVAGASFLAWLVAYGLKVSVHAPRPFVTFPSIHALLAETPFDSFPSGHATVFFALATAVYLRNRKAGVFFYVCAFLISIGRVIAGIHYPVDILAGAVLGVAIAAIVRFCQGIFFLKNQ